MFLKNLGGSKQKLITRLQKHFTKSKRTPDEFLLEQIDAKFQEHGSNLPTALHRKISNVYRNNFNAVDVFDK